MSSLGPFPDVDKMFSKYQPYLVEKFIKIHNTTSDGNVALAGKLVSDLSDKEISLFTQFNEDLKIIRNYQELSVLEYARLEKEIKILDQKIAAGKAKRAEILNKYKDKIIQAGNNFRIYPTDKSEESVSRINTESSSTLYNNKESSSEYEETDESDENTVSINNEKTLQSPYPTTPNVTVTPMLDRAAQIKENDRIAALKLKELAEQEKRLDKMKADIYNRDKKKCSIQ